MVHSLKIKNKKKIKETGDWRYIYQNELDEACFQHDMAYGDFKYLNRRTFANKVLCDKVCNIAKNPKYDEYQRGLAWMVCKFFDKKISGKGIKQLVKELHKPVIRKFNKRKVHSLFIGNIWCADLADMQLNFN